jgi:hypothetical protein
MKPVTRAPAVVVSIPSPREQHDEVVRATVAPVVRALREHSELDAVWFQRLNKPDWCIRVLVTGKPGWLEGGARAALSAGLGVARGVASFVDEDPDDKWTGGLREYESLKTFHHHDTWACLEALDAEARGALGSRAQFSVVVIERLLDALGIRGAARLAFYRQSFEWAVASGRWDAEVFEALERTFANQRDSLAVMLDARDDGEGRGAWPAPDAARIGRALLGAACSELRSAAGDPATLATFAAHAHSNRLGVHASQEATLRYLAWRARGGDPASLS